MGNDKKPDKGDSKKNGPEGAKSTDLITKKKNFRVALKKNDFNISAAARVTGICRNLHHDWMDSDKQYKLDIESDKKEAEENQQAYENSLRSRGKKAAFEAMVNCLESLDPKAITKPEATIVIFANKVLNGMAETVNTKTDGRLQVTTEPITGMEII